MTTVGVHSAQSETEVHLELNAEQWDEIRNLFKDCGDCNPVHDSRILSDSEITRETGKTGNQKIPKKKFLVTATVISHESYDTTNN